MSQVPAPSADPERRPSEDDVGIGAEKQDFAHIEGYDGEPMEYDAKEARRIRRKVDFRLLPILITLYTLAFLDRVNIGNARLWHMERDLDMTGSDFNIAVMGM